MRNGKQDLIINITLLISSIIIGLILIEILLAYFIPQETVKYSWTPEVRYDESLGWFNKPNSSYERIFDEKIIRFSTNAQGFRDTREYNVMKKQGVRRVLVLGDSFIVGQNLDDSETYTKHLARLLGDKYEVLNLGVSGYSTDQELILLKRIGLEYKPDIVIVGFYQNDISGVQWQMVSDKPYMGMKPMYSISNGRLTITNCCPVPEIPSSGDTWETTIFEHFHTYVFFKTRFKTLSREFKGRQKTSFYTSYHDNEFTQLKNYSRYVDVDIIRGLNIILNLFDEMIRVSDQNDFQLVIMNIPSNTQVDEKTRIKYFDGFYDVDLSDFKKDRLNEYLNPYFSNREKIIYLDLLQVFNEKGSAYGANKYYLSGEMHWNHQGARIAAEETFKILDKKGVI